MISVKLNIATSNASDLDRNYTDNENRGHLSSTWGEKFFCRLPYVEANFQTFIRSLFVAQGTVNKSRIEEMSSSQIEEDLDPP